MQDLLDVFRHVLMLMWMWVFVPCIFTSLVAGERSDVGPLASEIEFRAFRLQQYEIAGRTFGSKSWRVFYEAVSLNRSTLRRCVIVSWRDLLEHDFDASIGAAIGAVLIIIPADLTALMDRQKEEFLKLETKLLNWHTEQAVYFAPNTETLQYLMKSVASGSAKSPTAFQQLYNSVVADTFQITSENTASSNVISTTHYNVIGELNGMDHGKPYFLVVAHYDSHAAIPALAKGADANGSGMAALLELLAILSRFYASSPAHRPKYNTLFLLTAGGKFNFQGTRAWLDNLQANNANIKISFALCLDGLARGTALNYHVAKMPAEGTISHKLFENLKSFTGAGGTTKLVMKKIVKDSLIWEHETFNIKRIHAATLSHFDTPNDPMRNSILDTETAVDRDSLRRNVETIANAVAAFIFDVDTEACNSSTKTAIVDVGARDADECSLVAESFSASRLFAWLDAFTSESRSILALDAAASSRLVNNLHTIVQRYADKSTTIKVSMDDFTPLGIVEDKLSASVAKPAVFELLLAAGIGLYLLALYFLAQNSQYILERSVVIMKKSSS